MIGVGATAGRERICERMQAADGKSQEQWTKEYDASIADLRQFYSPNLHYKDSAERLRKLLKMGLLRQTDIR